MKRRLLLHVVALSALAAIGSASLAEDLSAAELARRTIERRATEAVIWGMPAVNFELMLQAFQGVKGAPNHVAYW